MENKGILRVGVVVNTTMKPSRDVLLDIAQGLYGGVVDGRHVILSFFLGSAGSKLDNLLAFASAGMHALIFNGLSRAMLFRFLAAMARAQEREAMVETEDSERKAIVFMTFVHGDGERIFRARKMSSAKEKARKKSPKIIVLTALS